jgi:hypothetical protein
MQSGKSSQIRLPPGAQGGPLTAARLLAAASALGDTLMEENVTAPPGPAASRAWTPTGYD